MKSIKEKAKEYHRVIKVINEHASIVDTQGSEMFIAGANYVLDEVEYILEDKDLDYEEICDKLIALVEQLKK